MFRLILLLSMFFVSVTFAQEVNKFDANGKRHGVWQKYYEGTKKLRYKGQFEHGKEVGTFKFYHRDAKAKHPSCIKEFQKDSDIAVVKYYTSKGSLLSEGKMKGRERTGQWKSYDKDGKTLIDIEHYEKGKLYGQKVSFYPNGKVLMKQDFVNDVRHGKHQIFAENGQMVKDINYKEGKMHGPFYHYSKKGEKILEGKYDMNKHRGVWKYYKDGKVSKTIDYTKTNNPKEKKKKG